MQHKTFDGCFGHNPDFVVPPEQPIAQVPPALAHGSSWYGPLELEPELEDPLEDEPEDPLVPELGADPPVEELPEVPEEAEPEDPLVLELPELDPVLGADPLEEVPVAAPVVGLVVLPQVLGH